MTPSLELPGCSLTAGKVAFPLTAVRVAGRVEGAGVVWVVEQTFSNPLQVPAEAVYLFPLPYDGAVNGMSMRIGERTVTAEIRERAAAEAQYREAITLGHTAGLVTRERAEIFTTHVGNIHPGEAVSVTITVHGQVEVDADVATLRLPTMIKERYHPHGLPDAAQLSAPRVGDPIPVDTNVTVTFAEPVGGLVCETFPDAAIEGPRVTIRSEAALRSDVVLRWDAAREFCSARWTPDSPAGDEGTLEVTIRTTGRPTQPRRPGAVSVLLDRSGSMEGPHLEWARRIVETILAALDQEDLVHVLAFDSCVEPLAACEHGFVPADRPARAALLREVQGLAARGGTELTEAIEVAGAALRTLDTVEHERIVVLISDGAYGDEATAMHYRRHALAGARVITVAIGENANGFLSSLAADGTCLFVEAGHQVAGAAQAVLSRIRTPALRHARIVAAGLTEQAPLLAPDIYPDLVVRLAGRLPRPADGAMAEVVCDEGSVMTAPITRSEDASITTRWAGGRLQALDAELMSAKGRGRVAALEKQIVALSLRYAVLSKYTAWLAVDRTRTTDTVIVRSLAQPDYELSHSYALFARNPRASVADAGGPPFKLDAASASRAWKLLGLSDAPASSPALVWHDVGAPGLAPRLAPVVEQLRACAASTRVGRRRLERLMERVRRFVTAERAAGGMSAQVSRRVRAALTRIAKALEAGDLVRARKGLGKVADLLEAGA